MAVFPAVEADNFSVAMRDLSKAGRNVLVFESADPEQPIRVTRASCESLTDIDGVNRAGVVVPWTSMSFIQLGRDVDVLQVSPSLIPQLRESGAVVGAALADGRRTIALEWPVQGVIQAVAAREQPPGLDTNSAVVVAADAGMSVASSCTVILEPLASARRLITIVSATLQVEGTLSVRRTFEEGRDAIEEFAQRPGRVIPVILGAIFGSGAGLMTRMRRSEIAVYRLTGSAPSTVALLLTLEHLTLAGLAATAAVAGSLLLLPHFVSPLSQLAICSAAALGWALVAIALSVDLAFRNPLGLAKDR
ncbi:hypothetical protein [Leifsonia soli]|uniref:ABC transporter permease n=1 Tax=Leifsonia soli TaxID=582665 RepID=A0A852T1V6_9MICO|nr:hypothetical protein [Leifsonia soli]NYD75606.1 hypothetical protein [Leifsonia soli]